MLRSRLESSIDRSTVAVGRVIRPAALFGIAAAAALWPGSGYEAAGLWLWAASLVVVGMPHGAYDLSAAVRERGGPGRAAPVLAAYGVITLAGVAALLAAPAWTLAVFLVLSAHHFGVSDSVLTRGRTRFGAAAHAGAFGRGLVVIGSPLAFHGSAAWEPFAVIAGAFGAETAGVSAWVGVAGAVGAVLGAVLVGIGLVGTRAGGRSSAEELAVVGGAAALAWAAPPLLAVGVYFVVVHASGHCLRGLDPRGPTSRPGVRNAARVHAESLWLLAPSVLAVLAAAPMFGGWTARGIALSFLAFCAAATLPHHLLWLGVLRSGLLPRGRTAEGLGGAAVGV